MIYHVDWENDDNSLELGQPGKLFSVTTLCKLPSIAMFQAVPIVMIDVQSCHIPRHVTWMSLGYHKNFFSMSFPYPKWPVSVRMTKVPQKNGYPQNQADKILFCFTWKNAILIHFCCYRVYPIFRQTLLRNVPKTTMVPCQIYETGSQKFPPNLHTAHTFCSHATVLVKEAKVRWPPATALMNLVLWMLQTPRWT